MQAASRASASTVVDILPSPLLIALQKAAQTAPNLYLQQAAGVALSILTAIQGARLGDRSSLLALNVCNLVHSVLVFAERTHAEARELPLEFTDYLRYLLGQLQDVELFVLSHRCFFKRLIVSKTDTTRMLAYHRMLDRAWGGFKISTSSNIVARVATQQEDAFLGVRGRESGSADGHPRQPHRSDRDFVVHAPFSNFNSVSGNQANSTSDSTNSYLNSGATTTNYLRSNSDSSIR